MREAVVSGATGFIGKHMVEELVSNQYHVTIITRNTSATPLEWIDKSQISIVQIKTDFSELLDISVPSGAIFFHFAWDGVSGKERNNIEIQLKNIKNTCDVLLLAKKMNCSLFINAGSIFEYKSMKMLENRKIPGASESIYSVSKLSADCMARVLAQENNIKYINLVISNIYGVGENSERFIITTIKKMLTNEDIPLSEGSQLEDFIYITDAIRAIRIVSEKGSPFEDYYIGNDKQRPLKEFVLEMYEILHSDSKLQFGLLKNNGYQVEYNEFDTNRLYNEFNFIPQISFQEGIKLLSKWILSSNQ